MMIDELDSRIRRIHHALGQLEDRDLSQITPFRGVTADGYFYFGVDFSQGTTEEGLANLASLTIANIASIKDHLKLWCASHSANFEGERLIDTNRDVAIIHDLWNLDKHGRLNRPPRSRHCPKIQNLARGMNMSTGSAPGSYAFFTLDPATGQMRMEAPGGEIKLVITGDVVNEYGEPLGDLATICNSATDAWEQALLRAGVSLPPV
jgi:hypothetical protein